MAALGKSEFSPHARNEYVTPQNNSGSARAPSPCKFTTIQEIEDRGQFLSSIVLPISGFEDTPIGVKILETVMVTTARPPRGAEWASLNTVCRAPELR
jgi:hypothetical protein